MPLASYNIRLDTNVQREQGRRAQLNNIEAGKAVADVIRTCLGPRAMLKMLMDPMGGIVLTNDGHAILREIDAAHPVARSLLELCRAQDEEVGDGTTSVIVLAGEVLAAAQPLLTERSLHPCVIIAGYQRALADALAHLETLATPLPLTDEPLMKQLLGHCLGTKMGSHWSTLICDMAWGAVRCVTLTDSLGRLEVDTKRYVRIEKIPGDQIEDSHLLRGVILNKDVVHSGMRRRIERPRVVLLDCPLEYKKGESQTNLEISREQDWQRVLDLEEAQIREQCERIAAVKPDLLICEKGISDLAQHYLHKAGITALRRAKKSDTNRIARACGATIVNRVETLTEQDVGCGAGLFEVRKIGDEYFSILSDCMQGTACSIVLRGPSKDLINEIERNLQDVMAVARNYTLNPRLVPGAGACEMALAAQLEGRAKAMEGVERLPYLAIAQALEIIPRTLIQNCGGNQLRLMTDLRAKHALGLHHFGIDGERGCLLEMRSPLGGTIDSAVGIWEPVAVKLQVIKGAIEAACLILRVDEVVSGVGKAAGGASGAHASAEAEE